MTRDAFEALMNDDRWSIDQRWGWRNLTPLCDAESFRREMSKPDGLVEVHRHTDDSIFHIKWKRFFVKKPSESVEAA